MWLFIVSFISGRCFAFDAAEFPEQLGDLERGQIQQFDPRLPGAGYMVQYRGSSISATVYVYDRGLASIPEETRSPLIFRELATVMRDVHRLAKRREQEEITIIRENDPAFLGPYHCAMVAFSFVHRDTDFFSLACVLSYENKLVKLRWTMPSMLKGGQQKLVSFNTDLGNFLLLRSARPEVRKRPDVFLRMTQDCLRGYMSPSMESRREKGHSQEEVLAFREALRPSLLSYCRCAADHYIGSDFETDSDAAILVKRNTLSWLYHEACPPTGKFRELM